MAQWEDYEDVDVKLDYTDDDFVVDLLWYDYGSSTDAVRIKHGYDRAGNRLWRRDVVSAAQATPVYLDELYAYDGMYQLTSLRRGQLNSTEDGLVADSKKFAEQWTLDPLGNWTNFKQDTDTDSDWELDQNRTHNKANEIAAIGGSSDQVAHDAAGNMTRAPKPENWASHYHFIYDPWNRLVEVQTADQSKMVRAYEYDGLNRMISKWSYDEDAFSLSEWRHYYYSDQWQFLEERVADSYTGSYSGSGIPAMSGWGLSGSGVASTFRLDRQFVWGLRYVNDLVLRDRDTDTNGSLDERLYALQDPNWNVVAIANTSGVIQERYTYTAYGKPSFLTLAFAVRDPDVSSYDWETLYCGYRYDYHTDSDVKWHIAGYRILLSHLGRWNRRDPIGYDGGINPHGYVGNKPITYVDPSGRSYDDTYGGNFYKDYIGWWWPFGPGKPKPPPKPTPQPPPEPPATIRAVYCPGNRINDELRRRACERARRKKEAERPKTKAECDAIRQYRLELLKWSNKISIVGQSIIIDGACGLITLPFPGAPHLTDKIKEGTSWMTELDRAYVRKQIDEDYKECIKNLSK